MKKKTKENYKIMKLKIIMDNGKEYVTRYFKTFQEFIYVYNITVIDKSEGIIKPFDEFLKISDKVNIKKSHISSVEEL